MTDYKMTDEWRKLLTEKLLGECWHIKQEPRTMAGYVCEKCGDYIKWGSGYDVNGNRIFTTDADMLAVFRKIRDIGKLSKFDMFCQDIFLEYTGYDNICDMCNEYQNWLFLDNPERACCLAADFLEVQG